MSKALVLHHPVISIVGPTASGKTALAQALAEYFNGEVVSADSMQVYQGMDIGTGKIPVSQRTVPYWGLDICSPNESYSAALFQSYARHAFQDIDIRGKRAILCGGTGLYVRAALDDYRFPEGEQEENPARKFYTAKAEKLGPQKFWDTLYSHDPESAKLIHPNNVRRVIRAFELLEEGKSYAEIHAGLTNLAQVVPSVLIGLVVEPIRLNNWIDERVDKMLRDGLIDEVQGLLAAGFRDALTAAQAIGYKEIVAALDGECSLDEAIHSIKISTHRYAKRQRTWFRRDARIHWLDANAADLDLLVEQAKILCERRGDVAVRTKGDG